jgi:O-antigen/teichoic acid export membrane protein
MIFIVLGLDSATAIYFYDSKIEEDRITILSTSLIFRFLFSTLFTIIVLIFAQNLSILLFSDNIYTFFFILSFLSIPFQNIFKIFLEILRLKIKPLLYSILSFLNVLLSFLLILLLLLFYKMRIEGIFVSYLLSYVTFSLLGFIFVRKYIKLEFDFSALSKMLKFGIPLIPASLAIWVLTYANRLILQIMTNSYEVGFISRFSFSISLGSICILNTT